MPTGIALPDARGRLFDAAERVLLRAGPSGLTSRAVTSEAGVAKGVLHRHFADFDDFLVELVLDRISRIAVQCDELLRAVGTGTIVDNITDALTTMFTPVAVASVGLVVSRDELRARLRAVGTARMPLLGEGTIMIRNYLAAERVIGRVRTDADLDALAPTLVGAGHLLFADRDSGRPPARPTVRRTVAAAVGGALP
jgi:AcrR family transcriptional regulator